MTHLSNLKPVVIAVSLASVVAFGSSAALAGNTPISAEAVKMNAALDQNQGGVVEGIRNRPDWAERINVSGLINVDAIYSSRTPEFNYKQYNTNNDGGKFINVFANDESASDIALADANLFVDATVNEWVNAHVALVTRDNDGLQALRQFRKGNSFNLKDLAAYDDRDASDYDSYWSSHHDKGLDMLRVDEAYFTIGSLERNPFYLRAGRAYVPFGDYQRYAVTDTLTQRLSQTSETIVQLGAVTDTGLSGSVYAFRGADKGFGGDNSPNGKVRVHNWGANLAYAQDNDSYMFDAGIGYLHNMADVDFIRAGLPWDTYHDTVHALAAHIDSQMGPFDVGLRYAGALGRFASADVPLYKGGKGAKPRAWTADLGYAFDTMQYHSRLGVTYQHSDDAKWIGPYWAGLPKNRWGVNYQVNLLSRTDLVFELLRDKDYSVAHGGTDDHVTVGTVRLSVAFA